VSAVSGLGAIATLLALAFFFATLERWLASRKPHELAWTQALAMFTVASAAYWAAGALGWQEWNFRLFYLFGAILNVPFLAMGTVWLLGPERVARPAHRILQYAAFLAAGVMIAVPFQTELPATGLPEGSEIFGVGPRVMAAVGSGVGAVILIAGAVWSAILFVRGRSSRRLALTNVMIAIGTIVLSLGGAFFAEDDREVGFGVFLVAGIAILFIGFLISTPEKVTAVPDAAPSHPSPGALRPRTTPSPGTCTAPAAERRSQ
jgi:hypothetical protein